MIKLWINSDFRDYYDDAFTSQDLADQEFQRFISSNVHRQEIFRMLKRTGIKTPAFGKVKYLKGKIVEFYKKQGLITGAENEQVVVYTDPTDQTGQGKLLITLEEAIEKYPSSFASQYVPHKTVPGKEHTSVSHKELHIGNKLICLI